MQAMEGATFTQPSRGALVMHGSFISVETTAWQL